ncbi:MAG: SIMPL domain-containing protein [Candidatus Tyrphobacter sp.]
MPSLTSAALAAMLLLSPLTVALLPAHPAHPEATVAPTEVAVGGVGTVTLPPDEATVSASIVTNDETSSGVAVGTNEAIYERVVAAAIGLGVARPDITLSFYNVNYIAPPQNRSATYRYGFTVQRTFAIEVRDASRVGKVIDAVTGAGATDIQGVAFGLQNAKGARSRALALAVADATQEAAALARYAHLRIVGIESITSGAAPPQRFPLYAVHAEAAVPAPLPATTLDSGNTTVSQTVTMVFLAKP